jgi:hypothetical protein
MSRSSQLLWAVVVLGIAASLGCGSHPMVTDPLEHGTRPGATADLAAPVDAPEEAPTAPGSGHGPPSEPPNVRITSPQPSALLIPTLPQHTTVHWASEDPDGPGPGPKKYFFKILSEDDTEFPLIDAIIRPDSLRRFYSPDYQGWTEVSGKETSFTLPDLPPNTRYLFVVQVVDRRGNEDVVWSLYDNMLMFQVAFASPANGAEGTPQDPTSNERDSRH